MDQENQILAKASDEAVAQTFKGWLKRVANPDRKQPEVRQLRNSGEVLNTIIKNYESKRAQRRQPGYIDRRKSELGYPQPGVNHRTTEMWSSEPPPRLTPEQEAELLENDVAAIDAKKAALLDRIKELRSLGAAKKPEPAPVPALNPEVAEPKEVASAPEVPATILREQVLAAIYKIMDKAGGHGAKPSLPSSELADFGIEVADILQGCEQVASTALDSHRSINVSLLPVRKIGAEKNSQYRDNCFKVIEKLRAELPECNVYLKDDFRDDRNGRFICIEQKTIPEGEVAEPIIWGEIPLSPGVYIIGKGGGDYGVTHLPVDKFNSRFEGVNQISRAQARLRVIEMDREWRIILESMPGSQWTYDQNHQVISGEKALDEGDIISLSEEIFLKMQKNSIRIFEPSAAEKKAFFDRPKTVQLNFAGRSIIHVGAGDFKDDSYLAFPTPVDGKNVSFFSIKKDGTAYTILGSPLWTVAENESSQAMRLSTDKDLGWRLINDGYIVKSPDGKTQMKFKVPTDDNAPFFEIIETNGVSTNR